MSGTCALVIGASGGIGKALVHRFASDSRIESVFAISRHSNAGADPDTNPRVDRPGINWLTCDNSDAGIKRQVAELKRYRGRFSHVCICNGILHQGDHIYPEKRLEDIGVDAMQAVFQANSIVPMLWVKHLCSLLAGKDPCKMAALSARVGSIGDNRLGGWYSYRASKAALNMLLQTAAVEYRRRAANVKLIAFHPGTTDTALSRPFQANVPPGKLFAPDFVAEQLLTIMAKAETDGRVAYLDWQGKAIPW